MHEVSLTYQRLFDLDADIDAVLSDFERAGIEGIDFSFDYMFASERSYGEELFKKDINEIKKVIDVYKTALDKHGIAVCQTHAPFPTYRFRELEGKLTKEMFNSYMEDVTKKCIELTAYLGSKYIVIHPAHNAARILYDEERKVNIELYTRLIEDAKRHGVIICLENMWTERGGRIFDSACANPYEARDYIDTLNDIAGEEIFGFCFDVGHANICGYHMQNSLRILGKRVKVLHIHDTNGMRDNHTIPYMISNGGSKALTDYGGFTAGLRDIGYEGSLNFESCYGFNAFPKVTHPALFGLVKAIGDYFSAEIKKDS